MVRLRSKKEQNPDQTRPATCILPTGPDELDSAGSLQAVFKPSVQANTHFTIA
jgi:hypothetical protein